MSKTVKKSKLPKQIFQALELMIHLQIATVETKKESLVKSQLSLIKAV
jgi:hypothetical protein